MPELKRAGTQIIHYEVSGEGPAILMLHGFLCDSGLFFHQTKALLMAGYKVIAIDLRGHGLSGACLAPFTLYDLVEDAIAVLDAEAVPEAVWLGLSMGGFVAMRAALRKPGRVRALVLLDTEAGGQTARKKVQDLALKFALKTLGPRVAVPAILAGMLGKTTMTSQPALVEEYRQKFLAMRVGSICLSIDAVTRRDDLIARLGDLLQPTLVLVGEEDRPLPVEVARLISNGIPGATLEVIECAGHLSAIERPMAVNDSILAFLKRLV
jgi:3-oxoadipate enol-lactonase